MPREQSNVAIASLQPPLRQPGFVRDWYVCQTCGCPHFADRLGWEAADIEPQCVCFDLVPVTASEAFDALAVWEAA